MALTEEMIANNKEEFLSLISKVAEVRGVDVGAVTNYFEGTDFFYAPASTKYHNAFKGGLCAHCLNVYHNLDNIVKSKGMEDTITEDSVIATALLHDMAKVNIYENTFNNVKVYCDNGDKRDAGGRFKWDVVAGYKVTDRSNRFVYGNHEETSEFIARSIVPLSIDESVAILKHHGGTSWDSTKDGSSEEYTTYPLACLLHVADMLATFCDENE